MAYANRGMCLERTIEYASLQYKSKKIARIDKIPTPIKVLRIIRNQVLGAFEKKATVDYVGIAQGGKYIAFDCKECEEETRFPLKNVKEHQYEYLEEVDRLGGVAFLIIDFVKIGKRYRLDFRTLQDYWKLWKLHKNKKGYASIPIEEFREEITQGRQVVLDYLKNIG